LIFEAQSAKARTGADRPLYAPFEGPVGTLYAELAERTRAEGSLLTVTPGSLALRDRPGSGAYWYRRHYGSPGTPQVEDFVCRQDDLVAYEAMQRRIEVAEWCQQQVRHLRQLGMQVADKDTARVLVELHNRGWFNAGLVYGFERKRIVGYDNERGKGDHRHFKGRESAYRFVSVERLVDDFLADVNKVRGGES
jgi:hypothetical protein